MKLLADLDKFRQTWLSNPAAQLDFVKLVERVHNEPSSDHSDHGLLCWIDEEKAKLKRILR